MQIFQNLNEVLIKLDSAEKKRLVKQFKITKDLTSVFADFYHNHYLNICEAVFLKFNDTPEVVGTILELEDVQSIGKISTHDPFQHAVWGFIRSIFMAACEAAKIPIK